MPEAPLSTDLRAQLQLTLGDAYRLERELGGGGMSRVFVAEEVRLARKVVVKVLSPDLAQGISVERFEREIKTVAALQQANIVPVLTAGDTNGLPFYTMPYVDGESLRARLGRGPLTISEVIGVLRDVARALAYAHARGVVHRDIKPDNVLISGGAAVVTDFGIAKAISAARTSSGSATLTQIGTSIGTPAYMAPEQAAGDPDIDHRADIYSVGAMAYELLAGQPVFAGRTAPRMLAAHMSEAPKPIADFRPDIPAGLGELVMKCLEKDPVRRPQGAGELVLALDTTSGGSLSAMPPILMGGPGMFRKALGIYAAAFVIVAVLAKAAIVGIGLPDWVFPGSLIVMALGLPIVLWTGYVQRVTRRALAATPTYTPGGSPSLAAKGTMATMALRASPHISWYRTARGGLYAFGVFVGLIAVFMAMRAFGIGPAASLISSGKMGARERVILADFKSPATDSTLGPTVTDAFRTDLGQSTSLSIMPASAVRQVLQLMQRPTNLRVDYTVAREIAAREGIKAVLDGEVVTLGGSYVLSARLVSTITGEELASFRETAESAKDIIPAISRLSKDVRSKVGESLRAVQGAKTLEKVTTPSLEALQKYVAAIRTIEVDGDFQKFEELMTQAIGLDTGFAMAYRKLAIEMQNRGLQRERSLALLQKAFDHADRLSEKERYIMLGSYYNQGPKPDEDKAVSAYESLLEIDPENVTALNNVASIYHERGEYAKAVEMAKRAIAAQPTASVFFENLVHNSLHLGQVKEAEEAVALAAKNMPRNPKVTDLRAQLYTEKSQFDSIPRMLDSLVAARPTDLNTRRSAEFVQANVSEISGRIAGFERHMGSARAAGIQAGNPQAAMGAKLDSAYALYWYRGEPGKALQMIERAVASPIYTSLTPRERPYSELFDAYVQTGKLDKAREVMREAERLPEAKTPDGQRATHAANGSLLRAEKKYDEAVREFTAGQSRSCQACVLPDIAMTYDLAGKPDSAIAYYTKFVNAKAVSVGTLATWLPLSHKRLGELYENKGNAAQAAMHYEKFVELWKNADPDMQPRVAEVKRRLQKLTSTDRPKS